MAYDHSDLEVAQRLVGGVVLKEYKDGSVYACASGEPEPFDVLVLLSLTVERLAKEYPGLWRDRIIEE